MKKRLAGLLPAAALLMAACGSDSTRPEIIEMTVMPYLRPCQDFFINTCLVVRREDRDTGFSNFSYDIEGFEYEWGYRYVLQMEVHPIKDPPLDSPSERYVLVGQPVRVAEPQWIMDLTLFHQDWSLNGDTLVIFNYPKKILVPDAADRDSLEAWKDETTLGLLVEPGEGELLRGSQVRQ